MMFQPCGYSRFNTYKRFVHTFLTKKFVIVILHYYYYYYYYYYSVTVLQCYSVTVTAYCLVKGANITTDNLKP